jgi:hypothetical protein
VKWCALLGCEETSPLRRLASAISHASLVPSYNALSRPPHSLGNPLGDCRRVLKHLGRPIVSLRQAFAELPHIPRGASRGGRGMHQLAGSCLGYSDAVVHGERTYCPAPPS